MICTVQVQPSQPPPIRLCFQRPIEGTSCALPLAAGREIEEPNLAASVEQANARDSLVRRCHHTEVIGIRDP